MRRGDVRPDRVAAGDDVRHAVAAAGRHDRQAAADPRALHHHDVTAVGPTDALHRVSVPCRLADWLGYWVIASAAPEAPGPDSPDAAAVMSELAAALPVAQRLTLASEAADVAAEIIEQVGGFDALLA